MTQSLRNWCSNLPSFQQKICTCLGLSCFAHWNSNPNHTPKIPAETWVTCLQPQRVKFKQTDFFLGKRQGLAVLGAKQTWLTSKLETVSGGHLSLGLISQLSDTPVVWFASDFRAFSSFREEVNEDLSAYKIVFSNSVLQTQLMVRAVLWDINYSQHTNILMGGRGI